MGMGKKLADASMAKIAILEGRLSGALKPVAARREFVHGLGERIQTGQRATLANHVSNWHILAALIAGFVSLSVLLAMVARALIRLAERKQAT
jgi:hypothetical protein